MKRKILLFVSAVFCAFALCACGSTDNTDDYNGLTAGDIQAAVEQTANTLLSMSAEDAQQYYEYYQSQDGGEIYADLMEDWIEVLPGAGEFKDFSDFEITKAGKTLTAVLTMEFTQRDVTLTYVMSSPSMEVTAVNAEVVLSLGEKMSNAGINTLINFGIVFVVLIVICLCIYAFRIIPKLQKKAEGQSESGSQQEKKVVIQERQQVPQTQNNDLIAVISAAIAAATGSSTDDFVVRSIKRRY